MKKHIFPLALIVLSIIAWLVALPHLPEQIATHWGLNGEVNGYSSKLGAMFIMVGLLVFLYLLFIGLPKVDPKHHNYKYFTRSYTIIMNSLLVIFSILNLLIIFYSLGYPIPMANLGPIVLGAIFIVLGNFMQTVRTNFFIGIRTPWTLSSEKVWKKTHRVAGKVMFLAGVVFLLTAFLPSNWQSTIILVCIILSVGFPLIYSYWLYRKEQIKN